MIAQAQGSDRRPLGRVLLDMCCLLITLAIFQQLRGVESCRSFLRNSARPARPLRVGDCRGRDAKIPTA